MSVNPTSQNKYRTSFVRSLLNGGVSATAGIVAGQPFMNIKVILQNSSASLSNAERMKSLLPIVKNPTKLFKGTLPLALSAFPAMAVANAIDVTCRKHIYDNGQKCNAMHSMMISATSGAATSVFVSPAELLFIRMSVTNQSMTSVSSEIYRTNGLRGMFRGTVFTTWRMAGFTAMYHEFGTQNPCLAAVVGAILTHPVDTAKTLQQSSLNKKITLMSVLKNQPFSGLSSRIFAYLVFMNVAPKVRQYLEFSRQ